LVRRRRSGGLITASSLDWDDELRQAIDPCDVVARCPTGLEANLRFGLPETQATYLWPFVSLANWIFIRPNAVGPDGALKVYGRGAASKLVNVGDVDELICRLHRQIPNNVDLGRDRVLRRALEHWRPLYGVVADMGPKRLAECISAPRSAWSRTAGLSSVIANADYRWGIFLVPPTEGRQVNFGVHKECPRGRVR
jgi:hypothetical protein